MAATVPFMPFLRPLALPKPSTINHFLRFSTSARCRASEDPNLVASRTAPAAYPPPSMKSLPRPKESKSSHRTAYPKKERPYPTRGASHQQPTVTKMIPDPVATLPPAQCAPNLPYFVTRTPSNELPIYLLRKNGGNKLLTRLKKIDGNIDVLKEQLRQALGLQEKDAVINRTTEHIVLKGHHKPQIELFLKQRMF